MSRFFKKIFSFFGLSGEDDINSRGKEYRDDKDVKSRGFKKEKSKIDSNYDKKNPRRGIISSSRPARKVSFISSIKGEIKSRVFIAEPKEFEEIQIIADNFKDNIPIIVNLQKINQDLSKRIIDFCSGLTYALEGNIRKVADKVFLITPYNVEVSSKEKELLQEEGLYDQY